MAYSQACGSDDSMTSGSTAAPLRSQARLWWLRAAASNRPFMRAQAAFPVHPRGSPGSRVTLATATHTEPRGALGQGDFTPLFYSEPGARRKGKFPNSQIVAKGGIVMADEMSALLDAFARSAAHVG